MSRTWNCITLATLLALTTVTVAFAGTTGSGVTIDASAGPNGSISPEGSILVSNGQSKTFTITADACYHIDDVVVDNVSMGPVSTYTFTVVQSNHTIAASFAQNAYALSATAGAGGMITPIGSLGASEVAVDFGGLTLPAGWASFAWPNGFGPGTTTVAGGTLTVSGTRANPDPYSSGPVRTMEFLALFRSEPNQVAGFGGGNQLSPNLVFNVSPLAVFGTGATGTALITRVWNGGAPIDFTVPGSWLGAWHSYRVVWNTSSVDFYVDGNLVHTEAQAIAGPMRPGFSDLTVDGGGLTVDWLRVGPYAVTCGGSRGFTITPDPCHQISDVLVDGSSVGPVSSYSFSNVGADHTIEAQFSATLYDIMAFGTFGGSISPSGDVSVPCGSDKTFTITAAPGFAISDVQVDGNSVGAVGSYTFSNVVGDHSINAFFISNAFTITATAGAGGSISPSGAVTVAGGASQSFTITPNGGFAIQDVLVDGNSVGAVSSYTFQNVTANHTIAASFAPGVFTISASAGSNGSISPPGNTSVPPGGSQAYTITPNTGYHVADVKVDGNSVGAVSTYTFTNVLANHTIAASFAINTYTITASAGAHGSISSPGASTVNYGGSKSYTITPSSGYHVADVLVDGNSVGAVTSYAFTNVAANHTIAASFTVNSSSAPSLTIGNAATTEGNLGSKYLPFTVTLSSTSTRTVTVGYATKGVTATTADNDYQGTSGYLSIAPGSLTGTINIKIYGDTKLESDETFQVNLSNPVNATIAQGQGIGTILNDDGGGGGGGSTPTLSIDDVSKKEGKYGTTPFVFTITLSSATNVPVTVHYATASITAKTSDDDYVGRNGTLSIAAGLTSATLTVQVNGDRKVESDETFAVNLTSPTNATIADAQGIGTIQNDDTGHSHYAATPATGPVTGAVITGPPDQEGAGLIASSPSVEFSIGPNPMRENLSVDFSLPVEDDVRVTVLDLQGRAIEELANGRFGAGRHTLDLSAGHQRLGMPAGVYFVRLATSEQTVVLRFVRTQ